MGQTLAYFLTWTTYGTWLPGDRRGWVDRKRTHGEVYEAPDPLRESRARFLMKEDAVVLDPDRRRVAEDAIRATATYCGWTLHQMQVRSNHAHVIITARDASMSKTMGVLKSYAARALNRTVATPRQTWWTDKGSKRKLCSPEALESAIRYVRHQDTSWMKNL